MPPTALHQTCDLLSRPLHFVRPAYQMVWPFSACRRSHHLCQASTPHLTAFVCCLPCALVMQLAAAAAAVANAAATTVVVLGMKMTAQQMSLTSVKGELQHWLHLNHNEQSTMGQCAQVMMNSTLQDWLTRCCCSHQDTSKQVMLTTYQLLVTCHVIIAMLASNLHWSHRPGCICVLAA